MMKLVAALLPIAIMACTPVVQPGPIAPERGTVEWYFSEYGVPVWSDYNSMDDLHLYYWPIHEFAYTTEGVDFYYTRLYVAVDRDGNVVEKNRYQAVAV